MYFCNNVEAQGLACRIPYLTARRSRNLLSDFRRRSGGTLVADLREVAVETSTTYRLFVHASECIKSWTEVEIIRILKEYCL